jgi:hypothetical protein
LQWSVRALVNGWRCAWDRPEEAAPLLKHIKDDYAALQAQVEAHHQKKAGRSPSRSPATHPE